MAAAMKDGAASCNIGIRLALWPQSAARGNRGLTTALFKEKGAHLRVIEALAKENIESRPLWKPMHMQPVFEGALAFTDGTSEEMFARGICLPSGTAMQDEEFARVVKIVKENL